MDANALKICREQAGLTQEKAASLIGCCVKTISRYESGKSSPKALVLRKMANTYKCSVYELLDIPRQ